MKTKIKNSERKKAMERQLALMKKGFKLGGLLIKKREDLYDRK